MRNTFWYSYGILPKIHKQLDEIEIELGLRLQVIVKGNSARCCNRVVKDVPFLKTLHLRRDFVMRQIAGRMMCPRFKRENVFDMTSAHHLCLMPSRNFRIEVYRSILGIEAAWFSIKIIGQLWILLMYEWWLYEWGWSGTIIYRPITGFLSCISFFSWPPTRWWTLNTRSFQRLHILAYCRLCEDSNTADQIFAVNLTRQYWIGSIRI